MSTPSPSFGSEINELRDILRSRDARFEAFMAHTPTLCWITDTEERLSYVNAAVARALGVDAAAVVGRSLHEVFPGAIADTLVENNRRVRQTGRLLETTEQAPRADGSVGVYRVVKFPLAAGPVDGVVAGIAVDVTEQQRFEQQLRQSQRLESLGLLAEGVAHNFNNMLTIIRVNAELLSFTQGLSAEVIRHVQQINEAAERSAQLTRQLLAFSRQPTASGGIFDVNEVVRKLVDLLATLLGRKVALDTQLGTEPVRLETDSALLEQMLFTLAINARDAMPTGGRFTIRVDTVEVTAEEAARHRGVKPGSHARLVVSDTGVGMSREVAVRAFEPFYTTKGGRHAGLGLSTVHGYVTQNHGWVDIESAPDQGATFTIYIPIAKPPPAIA